MNFRIIVFGLISILLINSGIASAKTWYVDDDGSTGIDFTKIQDAINAAGGGDTILVNSGTYHENLDVNRQVYLFGVDSAGGQPVVDGRWSGDAILIRVNGVSIEGFNVRNGSFRGIGVISNNNIIRNNTVSNNEHGIKLENSTNNNITGNMVYSNIDGGISLWKSSGNNLTGNIANLNGRTGIALFGDSNNTIIRNNVANNNTLFGLVIQYSVQNIVSENIFNFNKEGIFLRDSNSTLIQNNVMISYFDEVNGIQLHNSSYNEIVGNNASNPGGFNNNGIFMLNSSSNKISHNNFSFNTGAGISMIASNKNNISYNILNGNQAGLFLDLSNNNIVINNNASSNIAAGINVFKMSNDNLVRGNIARNNYYSGISLNYAGKNNTIIGNDLYGNGYEGIFLKESSQNRIYDNIVRSNTIDGIVLKNSSDHNTLINNTVSLNGDNGILIMNSSFTNIEGNTVRDHRGAAGEPFGRPPSSGIMVHGSHNIIRKNNVSNNYLGISILDKGPAGDIISTNNTIENNEVNNNSGLSMVDGKPPSSGILIASNNNIIRNNNGSLNNVGITVFNSSKTMISDNNMNSNNDFGIILLNSSYSVIERNTLMEHKGNSGIPDERPPSSGIALVGSHNIIRKNNVSNNYLGIGIISEGPAGRMISTNNTVESNDVDNNSGIFMEQGKPPSSGILANSNNDKIKNNNLSRNYIGITVINSSNDVIAGNNLSSNNDFGMFIMNASHSIIERNIVKDHRGYAGVPNGRPPSSGIILLGSHNIIRNNLVSNNYLGISIFYGGPAGDLISTNNTVEGNEVYQNKGITFGEEGLPPSSGILIASNDSIIKNNNGSKNMVGILIGKSKNNTVFGNNMSNNGLGLMVFEVSNSSLFNNKANSNNETGIYLNLSTNVTVRNNIVNYNERGIRLFNSHYNNVKNNIVNFNNRPGIKLNESSTYNNISGNTASKNKKGGIYLVMGSNNNIISSNTITQNNNFGIGIEASSSGNLIYNNFLNNTNNSKNDGGNTWNITKTAGKNIVGGQYLGGNFWASPNGSGFSQKCADGNRDGICDSSKPVPAGDIDRLPLAMNRPPLSINITGYKNGTTWINWTWKGPIDADFYGVKVYIDGKFNTTVLKGKRFFNATGFLPNTKHMISTRTVDINGNINLTWVNSTAWTKKDTSKPASITNLTNKSFATTYINWTWKDPFTYDFSYVNVYIDGKFRSNVTKGKQFFNATGFLTNTTHTISTRTVDTSGNVNLTWKNSTARTR